jgi:hypothetical protein
MVAGQAERRMAHRRPRVRLWRRRI